MKNIKNRINKLGLDYKKEMIKYAIIAGLIFVSITIISILTKNYLYVALGFLFVLVFTVFYFYRYVGIEENNVRKLVNDFINYFSFFRIYIFNGESVYAALNKTLEFASNEMKPLIEGLIAEINEDKSITPFMRFSSNFKSKLVEEIMISIFEMVENGNDMNYINQFTSIFENFKLRINKNNEEKRYAIFDRYITTSMVGSGLIMIILVFGIVNLIGEVL